MKNNLQGHVDDAKDLVEASSEVREDGILEQFFG